MRYKEVGVENINIIFGRKGLGLLGCKGALKLLQIKVSCSRTQKLTIQNSVPHLLISHASHKKAAAKFMHACLYVAEDHK